MESLEIPERIMKIWECLDRIADALEAINENLDSVIMNDIHGKPYIRVAGIDR